MTAPEALCAAESRPRQPFGPGLLLPHLAFIGPARPRPPLDNAPTAAPHSCRWQPVQRRCCVIHPALQVAGPELAPAAICRDRRAAVAVDHVREAVRPEVRVSVRRHASIRTDSNETADSVRPRWLREVADASLTRAGTGRPCHRCGGWSCMRRGDKRCQLASEKATLRDQRRGVPPRAGPAAALAAACALA